MLYHSQSASKQILWEAHDGLVLSVDWNPVTNCIVSGGEDAHYKVACTTADLLYFLMSLGTAIQCL